MGVDTPNALDLFVRASAFFGEQVRNVDDEQWGWPTPCADWTVQMVVAHVVVGDAQIPLLVRGEPVGKVEEFDASLLGKNPLATWRGTALAAVRAFSGPDALTARYDHPIGRISGRRIIGFRITDSLVHGWDVATACGHDVLLDPEIAEYCLDFWQPLATGLVDSGYWSPPVMPPSDDAGTRLLSLLGRVVRPHG